MWNYLELDENKWKLLGSEQTSSDFSQFAWLQIAGGRGRHKTSITCLSCSLLWVSVNAHCWAWDTRLDGPSESGLSCVCAPTGSARYSELQLAWQRRHVLRHSELQQQRQGHMLPMTWQNSSDLWLLLIALSVNLPSVGSAKEGFR